MLPTRLAVALGTTLTALIALSQEVKLSHPVHQAIIIVGGLLLAFMVHPGESGTVQPLSHTPEKGPI